jgi:delta 1-pyrroline-5-carboxylate dehydrogenase
VGLLGSGKVAIGGQSDPAELYIAPTVLADVSRHSPIMQEEVFGPILTVLEIESVDAVIEWVNHRPSPLGLYVFAQDHDVVERILDGFQGNFLTLAASLLAVRGHYNGGAFCHSHQSLVDPKNHSNS